MIIRIALAASLAAALFVPVAAQVTKQEIAGIRNYSRVDAISPSTPQRRTRR